MRFSRHGPWGWLELWIPYWFVGVSISVRYHWPKAYIDAAGWAPWSFCLDLTIAPLIAVTVVLEPDDRRGRVEVPPYPGGGEIEPPGSEPT